MTTTTQKPKLKALSGGLAATEVAIAERAGKALDLEDNDAAIAVLEACVAELEALNQKKAKLSVVEKKMPGLKATRHQF